MVLPLGLVYCAPRATCSRISLLVLLSKNSGTRNWRRHEMAVNDQETSGLREQRLLNVVPLSHEAFDMRIPLLTVLGMVVVDAPRFCVRYFTPLIMACHLSGDRIFVPFSLSQTIHYQYDRNCQNSKHHSFQIVLPFCIKHYLTF